MKAVRVSVPASTANLGPGFDCLGLGLELRNELTLVPADAGLSFDIEGEGAETLPRNETNLLARAAGAVFDRLGRRPPGLRLHAINRIPLDAGLGSSAAAVVSALVGANALVEGDLTETKILELAHALEGHADNAAASLYGGLVLVAPARDAESDFLIRRIELPGMRIVAGLPRFGLSTVAMRAALPRQVSLTDAVFNLGHALMTVEALRSGDFDLLSHAMEDRWHEPHRTPHVKGYAAVREAARRAGASAIALSGAGPTLVAFAPDGHDQIARAMADAWKRMDIVARGLVLDVAVQGVTVGTPAPAEGEEPRRTNDWE